jgi:hypothetical protein
LISQTIPNLSKELSVDELDSLLSEFYFDTGTQKGQQERYRLVLNVEKLGISSRSMEILWRDALDKGSKKSTEKPQGRQTNGRVSFKRIQDYLKKEKD